MLPKGWCRTLSEKTGKSRGYVHNVVKTKDATSPIWPDVIELAKNEIERIRKNQDLEKGLHGFTEENSRKKFKLIQPS